MMTRAEALRQVGLTSAGSISADKARPIDREEEEAAVWRVIEAESMAFWSQDPERHRAFHSQSDYEQWWGWNAGSGVTIHHTWRELGRGLSEHFANWPEPNWYIISRSRRQNKTIKIVGDVAWVTFEDVLDTDDLPGYTGPGGCVLNFNLLERQDGEWKIVFTTVMDEQFGQTDAPLWEIDRTGRVQRQNAAAASLLRSGQGDLMVSAGCLRMRDAATDRRLREIIAAVVDPPGCLIVGSDAAPLVYDPGDDSPVRVWWVVARSGKLFVSFNDPVLVRGRIEMAAKAFGLSPAQQRLAASIAGGLAVTEAAKREGVRVSTARTQLQRIYDKVGVHAQPALVQALLTATLA
jgi:DNA-binding CsgD family transcriptional regulator